MADIAAPLIRLAGGLEGPGWWWATNRPGNTQRQLLLRILKANANTEFGSAHRFDMIRSERDYRTRVPIRDFEGFRPFITRMLRGESSVLTRDQPVLFAETSGTTGEPKYLPVTSRALRDEFALMRRWYHYALRDHPHLLGQQRLAIVGSAMEDETATGVPSGSASGMVFQRIPKRLRRRYVVPEWVARIQDYDARYFMIARFALGTRISFIATPNPSTLIRLADVVDQEKERLIRAIHDGTLGVELPEGAIGPMAGAALAPQHHRARELQEFADQHGRLRPADCWPDLSLIGCWLGGSVGVQASKLQHHYGEVPLRDLGYMASEGHFSVPFTDGTPSGLPALTTTYFEFIPEEIADQANPETIPLEGLEVGKQYSIVITTASGLYRYDIHDVIEVTGSYGRTAVIGFVRKGSDMANITGEKLHVNHLLAAVEELRARFNLGVDHYRAVPDLENACYAVFLELTPGEAAEEITNEMVLALDQSLARLNVEYAQKRASKRLGAPRFHVVRPGWAEAERRRFINVGRRDVQFKWKILCLEASNDDQQAIIRTIQLRESKN